MARLDADARESIFEARLEDLEASKVPKALLLSWLDREPLHGPTGRSLTGWEAIHRLVRLCDANQNVRLSQD